MSSGGRILLLVSGLLLVAIGCAGGKESADDGAASTTAVAATAAPSTDGETSAAIPSPGCEEAGIASGSHDLDVSVDGAEYPYRIHVPTAAETGSPLPAVVGFHGFTQSIDQFEQMSGLPEHGEAEEYLVIVPVGLGEIFPPASGADVDAVAMMLDDAGARTCLDLSRVYATGISMGGTFTSLVGCDLADRFAAVAPVAGSFFPDSCTGAPSAAAQVFHGTGDIRNPYEGSEQDPSSQVPELGRPVAESASLWAEHNGCDAAPVEDTSVEAVTWMRWECPEGAEVELVRLEGGGHQWPGDSQPGPEDILGPRIDSIDATETMWDFFKDHHLSGA